MAKPWVRKSGFIRNEDIRTQKQTFLIVCEGEQTEPNYFKSFSVSSAKVECFGCGRNTKSLVEYTKKIVERSETEYDQVWCVFDKDDHGEFDEGIILASKENFKVAYSNESFELWYLLHFDFNQAQLTRDDYCEKLKGKMGEYKKNSKEMYALLLDKQNVAIKYAQKLYEKNKNQTPPSKQNPVTTVFLLVKELNNYR